MQSPEKLKFVILVVLDGWGVAASGPGNAIEEASTPNMDNFRATYPHTLLQASGSAVGLPSKEAGNTETGHLNLGAGRIVYQDLERINTAIANGSFFDNKVLIGAIDRATKMNSNLHYMGLIGGAGVHSSINHLYALIHLAKLKNFSRLYLHLFTDGRDSPPSSCMTYINDLKEEIKKEGVGTIASVMGRYWAMDRDGRLDRTKKAYDALTKGIGNIYKSVDEAITDSYSIGIQDEFIEPSLFTNTLIKDNDSVVFFNFRNDRARQLTNDFLDLKNLYFVMMTQYSKTLVDKGMLVAFPPEIITDPLGKIISDSGLSQLRMAESEKERFVTYYFDGQQETSFPGETKLIIPSPSVATYDQKPEMSAREITDSLLKELSDTNNNYSFILVNFANADMVGHTGSIGATVKGCEVIDECLGKLATFVLAYKGAMIVTADHGHAEEMIGDKSRQIETEHTTHPVPFICVANKLFGNPKDLQEGILADVAPTVLFLLSLKTPSSMTGRNLLEGLI